MTDREAIRRLASILHARVAGEEQPELVLDWIDRLMVDLAEPAAPTDDDQPCEHGGMVCEMCAYNRGHADGLAAAAALNAAPTAGRCSCGGLVVLGSKHRCSPSAPTVTQEQAEWMAEAARIGFQLRRLPAPSDDEMPAFFRAVAAALEGE